MVRALKRTGGVVVRAWGCQVRFQATCCCSKAGAISYTPLPLGQSED